MTEKELTSRTIPGITWKQVVAFSISLATVIILYLRLESLAKSAYEQSLQNGRVLKEMQDERKELVRINDAKIVGIELQQREFEIRLQLLEKFIEGYNKPIK